MVIIASNKIVCLKYKRELRKATCSKILVLLLHYHEKKVQLRKIKNKAQVNPSLAPSHSNQSLYVKKEKEALEVFLLRSKESTSQGT